MKLTQIDIPTLIINGRDDGCMDHRLYAAAIRSDDFDAGVRHETVDGAGHFVHLEQPELVNLLLLDHLQASSDR